MKKLGPWFGGLFILSLLIFAILSLAAHRWGSVSAAGPTSEVAVVNPSAAIGPQAGAFAFLEPQLIVSEEASPDGASSCPPQGDSACSAPPIACDAETGPDPYGAAVAEPLRAERPATFDVSPDFAGVGVGASYFAGPPPFALALPETPADYQGLSASATLVGTVRDNYGTPLSGVSIWSTAAGTSTNASGVYTLTGPAGAWLLWLHKPGYVGLGNRDLYLAEGEVRTGYDFALPVATAWITGRVTFSGGAPAANTEIHAWGPSASTDRYFVVARTDVSGFYVAPVRAGTWTVLPVRPFYASRHRNVTITDGQTVTGIDFTLELGGAITGTVLGPGGSVITDVFIHVAAHQVDAKGDSTGFGEGETASSVDGSYAIRRLLPGRYKVQANPEGKFPYVSKYYDNKYSWDSADIITVSAGVTTTNINFDLERGGAIVGFVRESGLTPIANLHLYAVDASSYEWMAGANTRPDGSYTLTLPSGNYLVRACASCPRPPLPFVDEWYDGVYNQKYATAIVVTAPGIVPNINFDLERGGAIGGFVYEADGSTPISGAVVTIRYFHTSEWMGGTNTRSNGSYIVSRLPTGEYRIDVRAIGYALEWYRETPWYGEATPVAVTAPYTTTGITFTLDPGGTISGTVRNADGSAPLAKMQVSASQVDGPGGHSRCTLSDGSFLLYGLPYGRYKVWAGHGGGCGGDPRYIHEYYREKTTSSSADVITVASGVNPSGIDFNLELGDTLSGTVRGPGGAVITDVLLTVRAEQVDTYGNKTGFGEGGNVSQIDGSYTIMGLLPGPYKVRANDKGSFPYVSKYYDNKYSWSTADIITVSAGVTTTNINFDLELGGTISGTVRDAWGSAVLSGVRVYASSFDGYPGRSTCSGADGTYSIQGLIPGDYRVYAEGSVSCGGNPNYLREYYRERRDSTTADRVSVSSAITTTNIDFTLELGGAISGTVRGPDGSVITDVVIDMTASQVDADGNSTSFSGGSSVSQADGSYIIYRLLPGRYKVRANSSGRGYYVSKYYDNKYSWSTADIITVSAAVTTTNISFTLELGGAIIGTVWDATGTTVLSGVRVYASSFDGYPGRSTCSGADGSYAIEGLAPGDYRVYAYGSTYCGGNPNYILEYYQEKRYSHQADRVPVTSSATTPNINFTLELGGAVAGFVYNQAGQPITDTQLLMVAWWPGIGWGSYSSQADGSYTIFGVPAGPYSVQANYYHAGPYIAKFYNNKYRPLDADPVTVSVGVTTTGISFWLEVGGVISGHVFAADGITPITNASLNAEDYATQWFSGGSQTEPDGSFALRGLVTGTYRVQAVAKGYAKGYVAEFYDGEQLLPLARPISITASSSRIITFTLERGGTISGTVRSADGSALLSGVGVMAFKDGSTFAGMACTDGSGRYRIGGLLPGNYRVAARGNISCGGDPTRQWEWYQEQPDVSSANLVPVTAPVTAWANTPNIDFTLAQATGSVSGQVTYSGSITGTHNVYIGAIVSRRPMLEPFYVTVITGTGPYTLSNIPYASYYIFALMDVDGDGTPGTDEPMGVYGPSGVVPGTVLVTQTAVSAIDIALDDVPRGLMMTWLDFQGRSGAPTVQLNIGPYSATVDLKDPLFPAFAKPLVAWLPLGTYTLTVDAPGYLSARQTGIEVSPMGHILYRTRLLGGDAVADEAVNIYDLTLLGANFGLVVPPADTRADITGDSTVSIFDIVLAGINYGLNGPRQWLGPPAPAPPP